jgi:hypothetical protein
MDSSKLDKVLFLWINSKGGKVTARQVKPLMPSESNALFGWLFTPGANGSRYRHAEKCLLAIRLRSKVYRLAGVRNSIDAVLGDLLAMLGESSALNLREPVAPALPKPKQSARASLPSPRKAQQCA